MTRLPSCWRRTETHQAGTDKPEHHEVALWNPAGQAKLSTHAPSHSSANQASQEGHER